MLRGSARWDYASSNWGEYGNGGSRLCSLIKLITKASAVVASVQEYNSLLLCILVINQLKNILLRYQVVMTSKLTSLTAPHILLWKTAPYVINKRSFEPCVDRTMNHLYAKSSS